MLSDIIICNVQESCVKCKHMQAEHFIYKKHHNRCTLALTRGILCSIGRIYGDRFGTNKGNILISVSSSNQQKKVLFCQPIESIGTVFLPTNRKQSLQFPLQSIEKEDCFHADQQKRRNCFLANQQNTRNFFHDVVNVFLPTNGK